MDSEGYLLNQMQLFWLVLTMAISQLVFRAVICITVGLLQARRSVTPPAPHASHTSTVLPLGWEDFMLQLCQLCAPSVCSFCDTRYRLLPVILRTNAVRVNLLTCIT